MKYRLSIGAWTFSIRMGTRTPRRLASSASSCTQPNSIEVLDQRTMTQRASLSALPIVLCHVLPVGIVLTNTWPRFRS